MGARMMSRFLLEAAWVDTHTREMRERQSEIRRVTVKRKWCTFTRKSSVAPWRSVLLRGALSRGSNNLIRDNVAQRI